MTSSHWIWLAVIVIPGLGYMGVSDQITDPWAWISALGVGGGMLVMVFSAADVPQHPKGSPTFWLGGALLLIGLAVPAVLGPI